MIPSVVLPDPTVGAGEDLEMKPERERQGPGNRVM